jgi:glycosyltransferase involved in cell wall biosynthesis
MLLYIHPHFTYPGGGSKWVLETAERLSKKGLELAVLSQTANPELIEKYKKINFVFIGGALPNKLSHWIDFQRFLKKVFREIDNLVPDIIFPQVFPSNYWGFLYKKQNRSVRCVWMCHEPSAFVHDTNVIKGLKFPMKHLALSSTIVSKLIDKRMVKYADKILTNSKFTSENVKKIYHRKSEVVGLGVNLKNFTFSKSKDDYIFTVSRLTKFKKIDVIIKAMKILVKKNKDMKLLIAGDGEEKSNLIRLTKALNLQKNVKFLGMISD